eukprot:6044437-Amphidinium_carterae.1
MLTTLVAARASCHIMHSSLQVEDDVQSTFWTSNAGGKDVHAPRTTSTCATQTGQIKRQEENHGVWELHPTYKSRCRSCS